MVVCVRVLWWRVCVVCGEAWHARSLSLSCSLSFHFSLIFLFLFFFFFSLLFLFPLLLLLLFLLLLSPWFVVKTMTVDVFDTLTLSFLINDNILGK